MSQSSFAHRRATGRQQRGGTLFGVIAGVLLGLMVAAAVAVYVTRSPIPFVDRASRGPDPSIPDPGFAPDPNRSLYGRDAAAGMAPSGPVTTSPSPAPGVATPGAAPGAAPGTAGSGSRPGDALGELMASLPDRSGAPAPSAPNASLTPGKPAPDRIATAPAGRYVLQVGAFRVLEDAEALKARLAFLGFDVRLQQAQVNGVLVNRVQVGPYAKLDDMNRARARLAENKVEATVVRQ